MNEFCTLNLKRNANREKSMRAPMPNGRIFGTLGTDVAVDFNAKYGVATLTLGDLSITMHDGLILVRLPAQDLDSNLSTADAARICRERIQEQGLTVSLHQPIAVKRKGNRIEVAFDSSTLDTEDVPEPANG